MCFDITETNLLLSRLFLLPCVMFHSISVSQYLLMLHVLQLDNICDVNQKRHEKR